MKWKGCVCDTYICAIYNFKKLKPITKNKKKEAATAAAVSANEAVCIYIHCNAYFRFLHIISFELFYGVEIIATNTMDTHAYACVCVCFLLLLACVRV